MSQDRRPRPTAGEIAALAYQKYEERGRHDGHDLDDWLQAEREIRQGRILAEAALGLYGRRTS